MPKGVYKRTEKTRRKGLPPTLHRPDSPKNMLSLGRAGKPPADPSVCPVIY